MIKYSEDFKNRCKVAYPDWEELHAKLDNNNGFVGRYLCDSCKDGVDNKKVLSATSLDELKEIANLNMLRNKLYGEWLKNAQE